MSKYYISFGCGHLGAFNIPEYLKSNVLLELEAETEMDARDIVFKIPSIKDKFCTSYKDLSIWKDKAIIYTLEELFDKFIIREEPCGNCDCGVYSLEAMLNPIAREFIYNPNSIRKFYIPLCKKDKNKGCAGYFDYHSMILNLDKHLDEIKNKRNKNE